MASNVTLKRLADADLFSCGYLVYNTVVLESRKLWPLTAVHGCSGHKMATNCFGRSAARSREITRSEKLNEPTSDVRVIAAPFHFIGGIPQMLAFIAVLQFVFVNSVIHWMLTNNAFCHYLKWATHSAVDRHPPSSR